MVQVSPINPFLPTLLWSGCFITAIATLRLTDIQPPASPGTRMSTQSHGPQALHTQFLKHYHFLFKLDVHLFLGLSLDILFCAVTTDKNVALHLLDWKFPLLSVEGIASMLECQILKLFSGYYSAIARQLTLTYSSVTDTAARVLYRWKAFSLTVTL